MTSPDVPSGAPLAVELLSLLRAPLRGSARRALQAGRAIEHLAAQSASGRIRVAVVRNDGIGDWLLTIPLVNALQAAPAVESVTLVAPGGYRSLLRRSDAVSYVDFTSGTIVAPPPPGGTLGKVRAVSWLTGNRSARLGSESGGAFDLVIVPRWDTDLGFNARHFAVATEGPVAGHDPASVPGLSRRERGESRMLSVAVHSPDGTHHEVEHLESLMGALGLPSRVASGFGAEYFGVTRTLSESSPIVIHPTSVEPKRQWPISSWRSLIGMLESVAPIVVIGSAADKTVIDQIIDGFGARVSAEPGTIPLGDLPAFFARARSFVGNDSGPAHIAASVGTPVVVVSPHPVGGDPAHRNSPDRFRPWGDDVVVIRPPHAVAPCTSSCTAKTPHCIASISVSDVMAGFAALPAH